MGAGGGVEGDMEQVYGMKGEGGARIRGKGRQGQVQGTEGWKEGKASKGKYEGIDEASV